MAICRVSSISGILCTITAIIFCCVGLFSNVWWQQFVPDTQDTFDLFTVVNCTKDLCVLSPDGTNEGFILFEQSAAIIQLIMLIAAIVFECVGFVVGNQLLLTAASGGLGLACLSSVVQVGVLSQKYLALTEAYMTTIQQPMGYVVYKTLPLGMLALSGCICIPAFICLVIYRTEERNIRLKTSDK